MLRIVAFVGMAGSGKSAASDVARELGLPVVNMGDVVRNEAHERNLPMTDASIGKLANDLRRADGVQAIAIRCIPVIRSKKSALVVVDGIRSLDEVEAFRSEFGDELLLVHIDASFEIRKKRLSLRGREDDPELDMEARDSREIEWGLDKAISAADTFIDNSRTMEEFRNDVTRLFGEQLYSATIAVALYPTEELSLVSGAVVKLFGDVTIEFECEDDDHKLYSSGVSLLHFHDILREHRILDTARKEMLSNRDGEVFVVHFNKQAACNGKVSFAVDDGPLGNIALRVESERLLQLIDWLAPITEEGLPVREVSWP